MTLARSNPDPVLQPPAIAIILARAGSKGVPHKNTALIAGRPCIEWTFEHAMRSRRVGLVAVSTDDPAIRDLAHAHKLMVIDRPTHLASDTARVDDAARHAVQQLEVSAGLRCAPNRPIVILYGNVPVRPADLTDRAVELLLASNADSVQSYQPVGKHHPWWTARLADDGSVAPWEGDVLNHGVFRRQELPPAYIPDGGVIAVTKQALTLELDDVPEGPHAFFGVQRRGVVNPEGSVVDIDAPTDLLVADAILRGSRSPELAPASAGEVR